MTVHCKKVIFFILYFVFSIIHFLKCLTPIDIFVLRTNLKYFLKPARSMVKIPFLMSFICLCDVFKMTNHVQIHQSTQLLIVFSLKLQ